MIERRTKKRGIKKEGNCSKCMENQERQDGENKEVGTRKEKERWG